MNNLTQESQQVPQQALQQESVEQEVSYVVGNRAQVMYDTPDDDTSDLADEDESIDESLTTANEEDSDEFDVDLSDLPLDPEEEEEDFVEGSPRFEQFKEDFNKAFGLPLEEARDLVQSLKADQVKRELNDQKYELSSLWDVPVTVVNQRLAVVAKMWEKLPADKRLAYDSVKGAQLLWNQYETSKTSKAAGKVGKSLNKSATPAKQQSKYLYTQKQIDAMDAATYSREAQKIMVAYAQGKVKR